VRRGGLNSVDRRAVVAAARKLALLALALGRCFPSSAQATAPPLAATRFLVEAVAPLERETDAQTGRVGRLIELFDRLERRERLHGPARSH